MLENYETSAAGEEFSIQAYVHDGLNIGNLRNEPSLFQIIENVQMNSSLYLQLRVFRITPTRQLPTRSSKADKTQYEIILLFLLIKKPK